jgi:hypothetical protein
MIRAGKKFCAAFSALTLMGTMLGMIAAESPAGATGATVVVGAGDMAPVHATTPQQQWAFEDTNTQSGTLGFVSGPAGQPGGTGSLAMSVTNSQHEWIVNYQYGFCASGQPLCTSGLAGATNLSDISALSYSTYRTSGGQMPTLNMEVSPPGDGTGYTTFVYVPDATAYLNNTWQPWDAFSDSTPRWYSTRSNVLGGIFNCASQSAGCIATWAQIVASYPNAKVLGGIGPNVGTGGTFAGNVDNLTIGVSSNNTVFDFEPDCTTVCNVNGTTGNDNNTGLAGDPLKTIQAGVNKVSSGGTVQVAAGTYVENVTVTKALTLAGAGQNSTIIQPALEGPNPPSCGSLCAGASSVILVQADNVTIHDLGIDGNNPGLSSGNPPVGGSDIDARNGIITNHNAGVFNNLSVHDTTVKNVYLRGMYASSGGTFNFSNDTIDNVQADPSSVAMFNFGGSGTMSGNHVSNAGDAISANHSTGTAFTNNVITTSASGVHTDNFGDSGGTSDTISGNNVSACTPGGYGVWAFVPYKALTISNNTVTGCNVGMAVLASCAIGGAVNCPASTIPTVTLTGNTVTAGVGDTGLYVTTNSFGFGDADTHVSADHNTISGVDDGVYVEETGTAHATVAVNRNSLAGDTMHGINNAATTTVAGTCNWWGSSSGPSGVGPGSGSAVTANVTYANFLTTSNLNGSCTAAASPLLYSGVDQTLAEGSTGDHPVTIPVTLSSPQAGAVTVHWATVGGTAKKGSDFLSASGILTFPAGQTSESVTVSVNGDTKGEPNEAFSVALSAPVGATVSDASTTIALLNDDLVAKKMKAGTAFEGGSVPFTLNVKYPMATATTLHFCTTAGTATEGGPTADYTYAECPTQSAITLPAESTAPITVSVPTHVDSTTEPTETFTMTVTAVGDLGFSVVGKGTIKGNKV